MMFCFNAAKRRERAAAAARECRESAEKLVARKAAQAQCRHRDWIAYGSNVVGQATCTECGALLNLDDRLNIMNKHFNEVLAALNYPDMRVA